MSESKKILRQSKELINRIKWDSNFEPEKLIIGYLDRFVGIMECNLEIYDIGDIPMHRIYYLKYDDVLVWDRETKMDKLSFATSHLIFKFKSFMLFLNI
jgi:poly(A) polymerase